jgi:hypothetical protein
MRNFTDSTGIEWSVIEVKRQGKSEPRWNYLPKGFGNGWLCFESESAKRRLTPVPEQWRSLPDAQLEVLLWKALAVNRPRPLIGSDVSEITSPGDSAEP